MAEVCRVVCVPDRSQPRPFTPGKLAGITRRVCRDYGPQETRIAFERAMGECQGGGVTAPCDLLDAVIHSIEAWGAAVGPVVDWLLWAVDSLEHIERIASKLGIRLDVPDLPVPAVAFLRDLRGGEVIRQLNLVKARSNCFSTGGGF